jgi:hypothetical protein
VVTATNPGSVVLPPVGRLIEVDVDSRWRPDPGAPAATRRPGPVGRLSRLAYDPGGTIRRVLGRDAGSPRALAPAALALETIARGLAAGGPVEIIAVDGHDHVASIQAVRAGQASMAGGGLRRLADEWGASEQATGDAVVRADDTRPEA